MDYAEGADHAFTVRRHQIPDHDERSIAGAAVRFDERLRRCANARAADRIADEAQHRLLELAAGSNLDGGAVGEKGLGDLAEVLHVRSKHDRLAVMRGFENI